jgi:hypothetical protein
MIIDLHKKAIKQKTDLKSTFRYRTRLTISHTSNTMAYTQKNLSKARNEGKGAYEGQNTIDLKLVPWVREPKSYPDTVINNCFVSVKK